MTWISDNGVRRLLNVVNDPDFTSTKYRIVREIGRGGMGAVYLAVDSELDRHIAIKVLNPFDSRPDLARRMQREAQILARLEHPGIVPVHDVGTLDDGRVYYAMKYVRGLRLDEYAAKTSTIKDRLKKFQAACEAVAFAHAHGVIHRDLKPQNIMIGPFGEVLVLDWGVAKIMRAPTNDSAEADTLLLPPRQAEPSTSEKDEDTTHGTIIGTPGYMSPEQAKGEIGELSERSDVYALGAILYFLLANAAPKTDNLARPRELNRKITKASEAVCLKAMAQLPADRYTNANELTADVAGLIDGEPVSAYRENIFERVARWVGRNRLFVLLVLAYLLMRLLLIFTSPR